MWEASDMGYSTHSSVIYNLTGQLLEFVPPFAEVIIDGAPSASAAVVVLGGTKSNDDTAEFTATATMDSVSTTVSAGAGYNATSRRVLSLASTASIVVGRQYCVAGASSGQREIVVPASIGTASITLEDDLSYVYASSDTLKGLRQTITVDATFIADSSKINMYGSSYGSSARSPRRRRSSGTDTLAPPYRVRWSYTTGSTSRQSWTYFDVVRQQAKHHLSIHDLREVFPDVTAEEWRGQRGQGFLRQLDAAWDRFQFDVRCSGYDVDMIREGPMVDQLVRKAWLMIIAEAGVCPGNRDLSEFVAEKQKDYVMSYRRAIEGALNVWVDTGSSGGITPAPARKLTLRR